MSIEFTDDELGEVFDALRVHSIAQNARRSIYADAARTALEKVTAAWRQPTEEDPKPH